jgi:hypothetical protein
VNELYTVAKHQNLEFKRGDILLIRGGFSLWYEACADNLKAEKLKKTEFIGVKRSMDMARFLWNNHFSAVATDSIGFEQCPVPFGSETEVVLHEWIIAHWGMGLGELWNLEPLSKLCAEQKQWSFLFTSHPLYVHGGVASLPNAIALL